MRDLHCKAQGWRKRDTCLS
ncbi:hypothetical protein P1X07_07850 [Streptococcus equi]|nr:hypothetical protein [Streptococcus equi]WGS36253.1 hypothetical protein P1X07_07850 [Streptococcus equi]